MTLEFVDNNINKKIAENDKIIKYTFYELRIKNNLSQEETYTFLTLVKTKLENLNYTIYKTGQKYVYNDKNRIVENNELLVAIKIKIFILCSPLILVF